MSERGEPGPHPVWSGDGPAVEVVSAEQVLRMSQEFVFGDMDRLSELLGENGGATSVVLEEEDMKLLRKETRLGPLPAGLTLEDLNNSVQMLEVAQDKMFGSVKYVYKFRYDISDSGDVVRIPVSQAEILKQ